MKRAFFLLICILFLLTSCTKTDVSSHIEVNSVKITDSMGNTAELSENSKIAVCYGSFADCLQLAGMEPVAVTSDAAEEHGLNFPESTSVIGTVKQINLESLMAVSPDYVILSADLSAHLKLEDSLKQAGLNYGYFRVDTFEDYKSFMKQFCAVTRRDDLYEKNVLDTEKRIEKICEKIPKECDKTVLLMRVFSTGMKAKTDDNLAGLILKEFGLKNIADSHPSILEELSVEQIITDDPDYIFASTMGSEKSALEYLEQNAVSNPAWSGLSAVKNDRYIMLPKNLFHYKPNEEWDKAYEYLAKIIFPEIFGE